MGPFSVANDQHTEWIVVVQNLLSVPVLEGARSNPVGLALWGLKNGRAPRVFLKRDLGATRARKLLFGKSGLSVPSRGNVFAAAPVISSGLSERVTGAQVGRWRQPKAARTSIFSCNKRSMCEALNAFASSRDTYRAFKTWAVQKTLTAGSQVCVRDCLSRNQACELRGKKNKCDYSVDPTPLNSGLPRAGPHNKWV